MSILAIDADVKKCGVAQAANDGGIVWAGVTPPDKPIWPSVSHTVSRIYAEGADRKKVSMRDLIAMQHAGSSLAGRYAKGLDPGVLIPIELVFASEWTGTVEKQMRQQRTLDELTPEEKRFVAAVPKSFWSEVIDAIGLAMFVTGRTGRGGVPCRSK